MADPTFEEIAAGLYSGPPEAFVASRKARADEAGDSALASRIRSLRKPSLAAWVVNVFAQERAAQLAEALHLAQELREAQEDLDAAAMAKLGRERRALTRRLAQAAAELAGSRGERITPATLEAVEQSLSAAFFDPAAAGAVASGRLLRALDPSTAAGDIRDAVVGEVTALAPAPQRPPDELQARRVRRDAERRLAAAEKEQASAAKSLENRDAELHALEDRAEELSERVTTLEEELARVREESSRVKSELPRASETRAEAAAQAEAAVEAAAAARRALDEL